MNRHADEVSEWWNTSIINMAPGKIALRDRPIEQLIGNVSFVQMIWLMIRGNLPTPEQSSLLEAALVAGVDHGPQAPSICAARMAATCGLGLNSVIATGVNMLGDVHGGAGEQCAELYVDIAARLDAGENFEIAVGEGIAAWRKTYGKIISGFGHRFHKPIDPRAPRLLDLVRKAEKAGAVSGKYAKIAEAVQFEIGRQRAAKIAMNIDGATAVIFCELGFSPPLARGLFCLSRSVGILAHGWEQMQQGERNKGPMPPKFLPQYNPERNDE